MRKSVVLLLPIILPLVLLNGCSLFKKPKPEIHYVRVGNDPAMVQLNKVAERSERSTQVLAQIQEAQAYANITLRGAKHATLAVTATPVGWGKKTSVSFEGPFNKVLYSLATKADYEYREEGQIPANIPIVSVEAQNQTLKSILDQVVSQLPKSIGVAIYPKTKTFIVSYNIRF